MSDKEFLVMLAGVIAFMACILGFFWVIMPILEPLARASGRW